LPAYIIIAQADLLIARNTLEDLLNSEIQRTQALKAEDDAQKTLEDALHPETIQAQALVDLAEAEIAVEDAQRNYEIVSSSPPQSAIDQAYANLLLAENKLEKTEENLEQLKNKKIGIPVIPGIITQEMIQGIKNDLKRAVKQFEFLLIQDKQAYENALARYNALLEPHDPIDVAVFEAELAAAKAQLMDAQREWERIKDGISPVEIAVLEAELADARREVERVEDGPHPDDILVLETQINAAEAAIGQMNIVAPFDGTVTNVKTLANDLVNPGTLAFRIDDLSHLYVNLDISEIDVNRIEIGQKVMLSLDAILAKEYQGEVVEIAMVGTEILGAITYRVSVEVIDPDPDIKPGMTSSAKIVINEVDDALLVPSQAIRGLNGDRVVYRLEETPVDIQIPLLRRGQDTGRDDRFGFPWVFQQPNQQQIQPITITLGATSITYSEVVAGDIQAGDIIVLNFPSK
jgi:HlyD family secretion protein